MGKLPKDISDFMAAYAVDADELWEVRANTWAIKHKALERVACNKGITFNQPWVIEADVANKVAVMCVTGHLDMRPLGGQGMRTEWSIGEATGANCKNSYFWSMAEKRGKDRVILKLLNISGSLYSEDEADDFKRPNPHVTRPEDVIEPIERDQYGEPIDNIPHGDPSIEPLPKKDARKDWSLCEQEIRKITTVRGLENWAHTNKNRVASFPSDWAEMLRGTYRDQLTEVRVKEAKAA